jgi:hypothetical protein
MGLRDKFVEEMPDAAAIFDFLERHWPKLVNAIESQLIPKTNNAVELVKGRTYLRCQQLNLVGACTATVIDLGHHSPQLQQLLVHARVL